MRLPWPIVRSGPSRPTLSTGHLLDGAVLPVAGNYYLRVRPNGGTSNVNYSFTIKFTSQPA